jgi:Tol biopolymer transport system component
MLDQLLRFRRWLLVVLLVCGAAVTAPAAADDLAQELKAVPQRIVFESRQGQNWDLFTVRADGSDRVNLTRTPEVNELCPHVSPDGTRICFVVDEGEGERCVRSVWCMNVDGSGRQLVARVGREPCWTADGRGIAYLGSEFAQFTAMDYATKGLFVHDLASGQNQEHPNPELQHLYCLACTPDGKWYIATVHAGMGLTHAILAIETHGGKVVNLNLPGCRPDVSPDGKRIAWASGDFSLAVGDLDFSGPEPRVLNPHNILTSPKPMKIQHIDWSPDGRYVAFSRGPYKKGLGLAPSLVGIPAPGWNICVGDPNATNRWVAITTDSNSNKEADWMPIAKDRR